MTAVWALALPDSEKIVLLALADCANDEGHCWPGMRSLMAKTSKSERTIQGAIKSLCAAGHLTRREVPGKGCNYTVHPRKDCTPAETAPPQGTTLTPAATAGKPSRTVNTEAKASYGPVVELWNELGKASGIPAVRVMNNSRKQMLAARVKEHGIETMLEAVRKVHASRFCRGLEGDGRKADIMLILQPRTLPRVLEGFYGEAPTKAAKVDLTADDWETRARQLEAVGMNDNAAECRRKAEAMRSAA